MDSICRRCILCAAALLALASVSSAQARVDRNIVYGVYSGTALLMDVHYPTRPNGVGVLHIAGSGWYRSTAYSTVELKERLEPYVPSLLAAGYTVFSISHRSSPGFQYPAPVEDAQRAARFVRYNASRYGIDPQHIGGVGWSSGGHLVSLLGTLDGAGDPDDPDPVNRESARLQAVVARAAPLDLLQMSPSNVADALALFLGMRISSQPPDRNSAEGFAAYKAVVAASPTSHVSSGAAPFLLIHGDADPSVPILQSEVMESALKKAGVPVKLIRIAGGNHGLTTAGARVSPEYDPEIVRWFSTYLRPASSAQ